MCCTSTGITTRPIIFVFTCNSRGNKTITSNSKRYITYSSIWNFRWMQIAIIPKIFTTIIFINVRNILFKKSKHRFCTFNFCAYIIVQITIRTVILKSK